MKWRAAALCLLLIAAGCGSGDDSDSTGPAPGQTVGAGLMAPFYADISQVATESTLVLHGAIVAEREVYSIEGSADTMYGYRVYDMDVTEVVASADLAGDDEVRAGDTVLVGVFAPIGEIKDGASSAIGSIAKFARPLTVGEELVVFVAPFAFRDDVSGYAVSGGDFGVFAVGPTGLTARAPEGPLKGSTLALDALRAELLGSDTLGDAIAARRAEQSGPPQTPAPIDGAIVPTTFAP